MRLSKTEMQAHLDLEMARRSPASAVSFIIGAAIYFFFSLPELPNWLFPVLSLCIILSNLVRLKASRETEKIGHLTDSNKRKIYIGIFLNATLWSILFCFSSFVIGYKDARITAIIITMFGLMAASPFTLSYSLPAFTYFNLSWSIPQVLILIYKNANDPIETQFLAIYFANLIALLLYVFRQGLAYRKQVCDKIYSDIELKSKAEELLLSQRKVIEQTALTQHANRLSALGEMAAGVAHEINNPLAIVLGNVDFVDKTLGMQVSPELRLKQVEAIGKAKHAISRIAKIIKGLRTLTRQSDLEGFVDFNLDEIVKDTLAFSEEKFRLKGVEVKNRLTPNLNIYCRPVQISQILINLLNNAFDAMESESVPKKYIRLTSVVEKNRIVLTVSNPGSVIPVEIRDKLFQPFFTTKELGQGSGLGLSISRGLAQQHDGDLYYRRNADTNETEFCLELPLAPGSIR